MLYSVALIALYIEQEVNFMWQAFLGFKHWKISMKICKKKEKKCLQWGWNGLNEITVRGFD